MAEGFIARHKGRFKVYKGTVAEMDQWVKEQMYAYIERKYSDPMLWPITVDQAIFDQIGAEVFKVDEQAGNLMTIARLQDLFDAWKLRFIDGYDPQAEEDLKTAKANHYQTVAASLTGLHTTVDGIDLSPLPQADQDTIGAVMDSVLVVIGDLVDEG